MGEHVDRIGHFRTDTVLGRGGMGTVFHAVDERTGQEVALKVLATGLDENDSAVKRFAQELEALSRLDHAGITRALGPMESDDGRLFFPIEYVQGRTLAQLQSAEGPLPARRAMTIARAIFEALAAAHDVGIIHRDVKPSNVLVPDEGGDAALKVADFGLARLADTTRLTSTGQLMGTLAYMSPEQCEGRGDLDARVDVYAGGVVLYELLAGRPPFQAPTPAAIIRAHLMAAPPPLEKIRADVPQELVTFVADCLAKRREDRIPDARTAIERLAAIPALDNTTEFVGGAPTEEMFVLHDAVTVTDPPPRRRSPFALIAAAALALLLLAVALLTAVFTGGPVENDDEGTAVVTPDLGDPNGAIRAIRDALATRDFEAFAACCSPAAGKGFLVDAAKHGAFDDRLAGDVATDFEAERFAGSLKQGRARVTVRGTALGAALGVEVGPSGTLTAELVRGGDGRWLLDGVRTGGGRRPGREQRPSDERARDPVQRFVENAQAWRRVGEMVAGKLDIDAERRAWNQWTKTDRKSARKGLRVETTEGTRQSDTMKVVFAVETWPKVLAQRYRGIEITLERRGKKGSARRMVPVDARLVTR